MGLLVWSRAAIEACECPDRKQADVVIHEYGPRQVEELFLTRFHNLTQQEKQWQS